MPYVPEQTLPIQGVFDFVRDFPVRPKRPERLFFAIFPDPQSAAQAWRLADRLVAENRLRQDRLGAQRLHISLHHVGDYGRLREKFVYAARQAGNAVAMPPFEVSLRFAATFEAPRRRPLVLLGDDPPLFALYERLGDAMRANGLRAGRQFVPHMTLSYGDAAVARRAIAPVRFWVRGFALVHSKLWLTQYTVLARWNLCG
ncbi:2'-5' RNA ligase family protein [Nitratireductor alexandrii]|uniref:2'-5' RNA ligase family protein n=1 Tax=Nitratireductor alexandrii TaxID=2448161 RepID=UPI0013DFFD01|nr:2'-5' RNA ligase family protein [Nitratireductor alexandrii]